MDKQLLKKNARKFILLIIFSLGLAYIEAAVVVYLREIFYPLGFAFPLPDQTCDPLWQKLILTEIGREAATLLVLFTSAYLIGTNFRNRLACFLTIFAAWDIFYYFWLKILINWPASSLMEWDILFLIPVIWAGPVLAPLIISLVMLIVAGVILYRESGNRPPTISAPYTVALGVISAFIITQFCWTGLHITQPDYQAYFHWPAFLAAIIVALAIFARSCLSNNSN
jgi:multisubunit Na+/H+ antiporter MnhC subunit